MEHPPIPPSVSLTLEEQQAVIAFAERRNTLSEDRARELAVLTTPLALNKREMQPDHLMAIANWLLGRR